MKNYWCAKARDLRCEIKFYLMDADSKQVG